MNRARGLLLAVVVAGLVPGCVVHTDSCADANRNGICDIDEGGCVDSNANGICDVDEDLCDDLNANGICDDDELCTDLDQNGICDEDELCDDLNANGICDDEEGGLCTFDDDQDGVCWEDDCDDLDPSISSCSCLDDFDCDGVSDFEDCYDDYQQVYVCSDQACTAADNYCADAWYIVYCAEGVQYGADCQVGCTTDEGVWGQACSAPAFAGECSSADGACLCWCEDAQDECVNEYTIQYTREGSTYQVDCKEYCGGTCDLAAHACACP